MGDVGGGCETSGARAKFYGGPYKGESTMRLAIVFGLALCLGLGSGQARAQYIVRSGYSYGGCYGSNFYRSGCYGSGCYGSGCYGSGCYGSGCYGSSCYGSPYRTSGYGASVASGYGGPGYGAQASVPRVVNLTGVLARLPAVGAEVSGYGLRVSSGTYELDVPMSLRVVAAQCEGKRVRVQGYWRQELSFGGGRGRWLVVVQVLAPVQVASSGRSKVGQEVPPPRFLGPPVK